MTVAPVGDAAEANRAAKADAGLLTVYYDGSCPLCSAEIGHYAGLRGSERLCFVDVSAPGADAGPDLSKDEALRRFHVRRADGRLLSGAQAFTAVWAVLPAWRSAAWLARLPGAPALLDGAYRAFLPVRPLLSRIAAALGARPSRGRAGTTSGTATGSREE